MTVYNLQLATKLPDGELELFKPRPGIEKKANEEYLEKIKARKQERLSAGGAASEDKKQFLLEWPYPHLFR